MDSQVSINRDALIGLGAIGLILFGLVSYGGATKGVYDATAAQKPEPALAVPLDFALWRGLPDQPAGDPIVPHKVKTTREVTTEFDKRWYSNVPEWQR